MQVGLATNTADITVSGTNSVAGNIDITGGAVVIGGNQTATAGGNITINATGAYSGSGILNAAGNVVINALSTSGTGAITSAGALGIAVTASGGSISIGGNLNASISAVAPITLKASANLSVTASRSITTAGGNAILWSRYLAAADAVTVGNITLGNSVTITTNGGRIAMAGTSQVDANGIPTGYAYTTSTTAAVQLGTSATAADSNAVLNSGGGAITIFGQQASAANSSSGIQRNRIHWHHRRFQGSLSGNHGHRNLNHRRRNRHTRSQWWQPRHRFMGQRASDQRKRWRQRLACWFANFGKHY
jgi:hypothetical protein